MAAWSLLLSLALLQAGCANLASTGTGPQADTVAEVVEPAETRWHYVRFRFQRNEQGDVDSYLDALVADQILAKPIEAFAGQLPVWRFHRRWADDATGHQFSFMFMAEPGVGRRLVEQIQGHPVLGRLRDQGHLFEFAVHNPPHHRGTDIAASSDPSWPVEIQREWPHFIMGASRMWLGLVSGEAATAPQGDMHERYRHVEQALDRLWLEKGNHAFFHHLSALFGYKPIRVIRRDVMRF